MVATCVASVGAADEVTFVNVGLSPVSSPNADLAPATVVAPVPPNTTGTTPAVIF